MTKKQGIYLFSAVLLLLVAGCARSPGEIRELRSFRFSYSSGTGASDQTEYSVREENGSIIATVKPAGIPQEEYRTLEVDRIFVREIEELLRENQVQKWNGFHKAARHVLDGNGFSLSLTLADGGEVQAEGYMRYPRKYQTVRQGLDEIFERLWAETEEVG